MASDGTVKISTEVDESGAQKGLSKMESLAKTGLKGVKVAAAAALTAVMAVSTGLMAVGTYSVSVGTSFESSMSQVAATMGTTVDQIQELKEKALEMGSTTSFSASEAADGLNILAMSGLNAEEQIAAIEPVLNLAAAGAISLDSAASYATATVKGFADSIGNVQKYTDLMAKGATMANTDVNMLGLAMSESAATANNYGQAADSMTLSLLRLAEQNVTGSEAATALNRAMMDLYTPTDAAKKKLDALGISAYDSSGKARDFNEVVDELNVSLADMSDEEANATKNAIFTTYGLQAFNKMTVSSTEKVNEFREGLANASEGMGAAAQQAETQLDNLQGQLTILKSGAEGFGILVYEELQEPLKTAVQEGISAISELSDALKEGGLEGAVEQAGETFAGLAVKVAEQAPEMAKSAVSFITAFANGIKNNAPALKQAAISLVRTVADELTKLLPASVREPVKKAINEIAQSFESGGFNSALKYAGQLIEKLTTVVGKIGQVAFPPFVKVLDLAADNLDILVPLTVAYFTAMKSYTLLNKAVSAIQKLSTAYKTTAAASKAYAAIMTAEATATSANSTAHLLLTSTMSISEIAVGVLTGKISLATAAQWAWNAAINANPIGLVVTLVAALAGGVAFLATKMGTAKEDTDELSASNENLAESYSRIGEAAVEFQNGISQAGTIFDNFNDAIIVSGEKQQELADTMDSIQQQITDITGTYVDERRQLTESEIQEMDNLFEKMHEQAAKELEYQQAYQEATEERARLLAETYQGTAEEYAAASQTLINTAEETREQVIAKADEQFNEELALLQLRLDADETFTQAMYEAEARAAQDTYDKTVAAATQQCGDTLAILTNGYSDRASALSEANARMAELQAEELAENEAYNQRKAELEQQLEESLYLQDENAWMTQMELMEQKQALEEEHEAAVEAIHAKMSEAMDEEAQEQAGTLTAMASNVELYGGKINKNTKTMVDNVLTTLDTLPPEAKQVAVDTIQGMLEGLASKEEELYAKAEAIANGVISRLKAALAINSPSKKAKKLFAGVMEGAVLGLETEEDSLYAKAQAVADSVLAKFSGMSIDVPAWIEKMNNAVASRSDMFRSNIGDDSRLENDTDPKAMYREQAEVIADAVSNALEGKEFKVGEREFARLIGEVG